MSVPFCGPNGEPILGDQELPYTSRGLLIGIFYLLVYLILGIPQILCFYALCHKKHMQYSCYKLMLMISVLDMFNLTEGALFCGILSIFDLSHCNAGRVVLFLGEMIMMVWFVYCFLSVVLGFNRVLEFVSKSACTFLFKGHRAWLWAIPAWAYALGMALSVEHPFYYFVPERGELVFFRISEDKTRLLDNTQHIVNNTLKGCTIAFCYVAMLLVMRFQLKSSGMALSKLEVTLSIQSFLVGLMSVLSSVVYVLLGYLPVSDISLIGVIGMLCWLSTHGISGYVYLIMNKSLRQTALGPFRYSNKIKVSVLGPQTLNRTTQSTTVVRCFGR